MVGVTVAAIGVAGTVVAALIQRSVPVGVVQESAPRTSSVSITPAMAVPVGALTVENVLAALDSTPQLRQQAAFVALLKGRHLEWTGKVEAVFEATGDERLQKKRGYVVEMRSLRGYTPALYAQFDSSWRSPLAELRKGDTVKVAGTVSSVWLYLQQVYAVDSKLIER